MNKAYKCLFVFLILLVSVGFACASDNIESGNETSIVSTDEATSLISDDVLGVQNDETDGMSLEGRGNESIVGDSSNEENYEIITSNVTKYDFKDDYKIKIVDESGIAVYGGSVDFYVNHNLATTSKVNYLGYASFNLEPYIKSSGTYDVVSIYSANGNSGGVIGRQSIVVDDVPMNERDVQILFENIKLYDLGEKYSVKVVDKEGNPVRKGYVIFVVYDQILYSNISESGIASCYLPYYLNFTGNLLVWSLYSDGLLYDLAASEQISVNTRTLVALDKNTFGSRMMHSWNDYNFNYTDGKYVGSVSEDVSIVLELNGKCYLVYEKTIHNNAQFMDQLYLWSISSRYDVVKLNLLEGVTYTVTDYFWEDQEWYYGSRFTYGQLIVNGNGATIKGDEDYNFLYVGTEANVNFFNVNIIEFNHCFINHGTLLCERCVFRDNHAYKLDVKVSGSGTVVHNYNTVFFDRCDFYGNTAKYMGIGKQEMPGSVLYAEPNSLNIFYGFSGNYRKDSLYCADYSTTIIYHYDYRWFANKLEESEISQNSYFAIVNDECFGENKTVVFDVHSQRDLINALWVVNTFPNANNVIINLQAKQVYTLNTGHYVAVKGVDWRNKAHYPDSTTYVRIKDRPMLDVGFCPVTINGNGATIKMTGNDDNDDYHFAYIGRFGSLTLNDLTFEGFNTALYVTGRLEAYKCYFKDNVIDYGVSSGDYGGAFRSHGGTVIFTSCEFSGNRADNIDDYSTSDFYADMSSYIELNGFDPVNGYMKESYLKALTHQKKYIGFGSNVFFEEIKNTKNDNFKIFNVSDTSSYNKVLDYLSNHATTSLYINFTGDYTFNLHPVFDRKMAIVFNSNGHNVKFNKMEIQRPSAMTFIGFNFNDIKIHVMGSCSFVNCNFYNNKDDSEDYFFSNEGSCTLINCSIYNNECDDYIISNTGTLSIREGSFKNNEYDDALIYNNGGSVSCLNTSFSGNSKSTYIFNFASGNCAISGSDIHSTNVEFDEPWANWKAGLVQGAFLIVTAAVTYGTGAAIGAVMPGVAGMIVASVAGAGIGAASGLTYGLIEGSVNHDYSNVWKHTLSFALLGLGMAQVGFATQADFLKQVNQAFNGRPSQGNAPGSQGPQGPPAPQVPQGAQGAQGAQGQGLAALQKDPGFREAFTLMLKGDIENGAAILLNFPELSIHLPNLININSNTFTQEMFTLFTAIQAVLSREENLQPNDVPINIINRAADNSNNINNLIDNEEPLPPAVNPLLLDEEGNRLVSNILGQTTYLQRTIHDNENLGYLAGMLSLNTYRFAENNMTHVNRVLRLLNDFRVLYNRASNLGLLLMNNEVRAALDLYNNNIGLHGRYHTINSLFDSNNSRIEVWERIYQSALFDLNRFVGASDIGEFNLDGPVNLTTQIDERITNLIQQLEGRFDNDPDNLDRYNTLRDSYANANHNNINLVLRIYRELSDLARIPQINRVEYDNAISFDYTSLIRDNIFYSVFNRPDSFSRLNDFSDMADIIESDMRLLSEINITIYNEVIRDVFGGKQLNEWRSEVHKLGGQKAIRTVSETYKQLYNYFNLLYRDEHTLNEQYVNIYYVKNLFKDYLKVYDTLSHFDKMLINTYFFEGCVDLIKSFNGLHYMNGLEDHTDDLNKLSNISDTSRGYFEKLSKLYTILVSSKGNDNLFNKNIGGLSSTQIGNLILEDLITFYRVNYGCLDLCSGYYSQGTPNFSLLTKIMNWIKGDSIDNLREFYNTMASIRAELSAVYKLEYELYFKLPMDANYYRNNIKSLVANRIWMSNEIQSVVSSYFGFDYSFYDYVAFMRDFAHEWFINNQDYTGIADVKSELLYRNTMVFIDIFNQYLKNADLAKSRMNLIDLLLEITSNKYPVNILLDDKYSSLTNITLKLNVYQVIELQSGLNPKSTRFESIDVGNLTQMLRLLQSAFPVAYWLLMDQFKEKYNTPFISETQWKIDFAEDQFCTKDKNGKIVTYYNFMVEVINSLNNIFSQLNVIEGNKIRLKSANYDIARLVDNENKYNNIFNKKNYYNQMELTEDNIELMIRDMKYDLNYLKTFDKNVYDTIINSCFNGADFDTWASDNDGASILSAYNKIFEVLNEFRDSSKVLENEINVLINQLDEDTIKNLNNNDLTSKIRSYLLNFIYLWQVVHKNTDFASVMDGGEIGEVMNCELLNASLQEIFNRYTEIVNYLIFHKVFEDDLDSDKLSLDEMKNIFLNNLYRAYHSPAKFEEVFNILANLDNHFRILIKTNDFRAFEEYINSINDKNLLINWYNAIHRKFIPHKVNSDAKPNSNPSVDSGWSAKLNEIKKIIMDGTIADDDQNIIYSSHNKQYFMGSWKLFVKKYGDISDIVLKELMNGNFDQYLEDKEFDYDAIRQDIVKFLENYKPNNNEPVKESAIPKSQFEDIKKIMEDCTIYPKRKYCILTDPMMRLYGSWESIVDKYPDIAKMVSELLFDNLDLQVYADKYGKESNDYKNVRQNIIEFIRLNFYKEDAPDIDVVVDPFQAEDFINGKDVSECSVDEIYLYILNKIKVSEVSDSLKSSLSKKADDVFNGYIQYVDLMKSAKMSENQYEEGFVQFKNRLVDILQELNSNIPDVNDMIRNIVEIMRDTGIDLVEGEISTGVSDRFLASWNKFEREYPNIAKYILETYFKNNMDNLRNFYLNTTDNNARETIIEWIVESFYKNPDILKPISNPSSNPSQNINNEYFMIEKENVAGTTSEQVIVFMQNAVKKANVYVEQIGKADSVLAASLKDQINKLYNEYLVYVKKYSHQWQYIKFVNALNKLLEGISIPAYTVNNNAKTNKYHIPKENLVVLNAENVDAVIINVYDAFRGQVEEIQKTNFELGSWISDQYFNIEKKYHKSMADGDKNSYNKFIDELNNLFKNSVGFSNSLKISDEVLKTMSSEEIENFIRLKIHLNSDLTLSEQILGKFNQPNLSKKDLIDIYNNFKGYLIKESNLNMRDKILTEGSTFFKIKSSALLSDINKVRNTINNNLKIFEVFFPNLYGSISKLFEDDLSRLSTLSLDECVNLYNNLGTYCNIYFKLFRNPSSLQREIDSRNMDEDMKYPIKRDFFNTFIHNFFDSSSMYFIRNLDNSNADTIKSVIKNEMMSIQQQSKSLHDYYMEKYLGGFSFPEKYFEYIDGIISPETANEYYQNLYKTIQNEFNSLRDTLDAIDHINNDADKRDYYIKTFEKIYGVHLDSDAAAFTRKLVIAIMNIEDMKMKDNITKMLLDGLNSDGSLKEKAKHNIIAHMSEFLFVSDFALSEADFEMAIEIMALNFRHGFNAKVMVEYMNIINNNMGGTNNAKDSAKYNRVLYMILKNKLLFNNGNVVLYPEELMLLNNLSVLRCYDLMNDILQLKLNNQYSNRNTVADGLIPGLNNILNSREYKLLNSIPIGAGNQHINRYYEIFNQVDPIPNDFDHLIDIMHNDLEVLSQLDPILYMHVMSTIFWGSASLEEYVEEFDVSLEELRQNYEQIVDLLDYWRNDDIVWKSLNINV